MDREAVSFPANTAEGLRKRSHREKLRFYNISEGSIEKVCYYLVLSGDLDYDETTELKAELREVSRILEAYMKSIHKEKE